MFPWNDMKSVENRFPRALAAAACAVLLTAALAACSSSTADAPTSTTSAAGGSDAADTGSGLASAKAAVAKLTDPSSSLFDYTKVVPTKKVTPKQGARIAIIAGSLSSPVTKQYADEVSKAADLAGMKPTEFDGKFVVATQASLVQQAVQQKFDGIVLVGVVPDSVASPLAAAKTANIPVVNYDGYGDDDNGVTDVGIDAVAAGKAVAQWIIADSGGTASVLAVVFPTGASGGKKSNVQVAQESLVATLKTCSGCSVKTKDTTIADVVAPGSPEYVSSLRNYPTGSIQYVASGCDSCMVNFAKLNTQLGRTEIKVTGGFAVGPVGLSEITSGANNAVVAPVNPGEFIGLLSIDTLARRMAGETVATIAVPTPLVTKDTVAKYPNATFTPSTDYKKIFTSLWT